MSSRLAAAAHLRRPRRCASLLPRPRFRLDGVMQHLASRGIYLDIYCRFSVVLSQFGELVSFSEFAHLVELLTGFSGIKLCIVFVCLVSDVCRICGNVHSCFG